MNPSSLDSVHFDESTFIHWSLIGFQLVFFLIPWWTLEFSLRVDGAILLIRPTCSFVCLFVYLLVGWFSFLFVGLQRLFFSPRQGFYGTYKCLWIVKWIEYLWSTNRLRYVVRLVTDVRFKSGAISKTPWNRRFFLYFPFPFDSFQLNLHQIWHNWTRWALPMNRTMEDGWNLGLISAKRKTNRPFGFVHRPQIKNKTKKKKKKKKSQVSSISTWFASRHW